MGKPTANQQGPKKDGFFINKKRNFRRPFQETKNSETDDPSSKQSAAGSGSFFVTPTEKQELLRQKEAKRHTFKSGHNKVEPQNQSEDKPKKVFDKKKWRLQKYSKKYKLEQWEEKRKKAVLHQYYKQIDDDQPGFDVQKIYDQYKDDEEDDGEQLTHKPEEIENENNLNKDIIEEKIEATTPSKFEPEATTSQTKKKKAFKKAHLEYQRIKGDKQQRKVEFEKKKIERAEKLKEYKQKKLEKYKKLSMKTKKGQPIMKYRMEMLLEQIQKSVNG